MRICHITLNNIDIERRILNQVTGAAAAGHRIWVLAPGTHQQKHRERRDGYLLWRLNGEYEKGGILNFIRFNIKSFFFLLFKPLDVIHCHDLWPLPAAAFASLLKNCTLIYDAHEYYAGLHIFGKRPARKSVWMLAEWICVPLADHVFTVSEPLAALYRKRYPQIGPVEVLRNLPRKQTGTVAEKSFAKSAGQKIAVFQGHFKPGRGLEKLLTAVKLVPEVKLVLVGGGELEAKLRTMADDLNLSDRVLFYGWVKPERLIPLAAQADVGLVLFEGDSINYRFALPNKFFEYIMAGIPVLASNIETLAGYVRDYDIGLAIDTGSAENIADGLRRIFADEKRYERWKKNTVAASDKLNWEQEAHILLAVYEKFSK